MTQMLKGYFAQYKAWANETWFMGGLIIVSVMITIALLVIVLNKKDPFHEESLWIITCAIFFGCILAAVYPALMFIVPAILCVVILLGSLKALKWFLNKENEHEF